MDTVNPATFCSNIGRIYLQHTRFAVAFARWNFLLFFSSKTIKNSNGQMWRLYAYAANECAHSFLLFVSGVQLIIRVIIAMWLKDDLTDFENKLSTYSLPTILAVMFTSFQRPQNCFGAKEKFINISTLSPLHNFFIDCKKRLKKIGTQCIQMYVVCELSSTDLVRNLLEHSL